MHVSAVASIVIISHDRAPRRDERPPTAASPHGLQLQPQARMDGRSVGLFSVTRFHYSRCSENTTSFTVRTRFGFNKTPQEVKCELGRVRRNTRHIGAPCSARHSHGVTGALLPGFRVCGSNSGCQTQLFWRFAAKRDSQPPREVRRISAGVLDAPDGHYS